MKLKIVSEGTPETTKLVSAETGEEIEDILSIEISMDAFNVEAAILVRSPHLNINNLPTQEILQGDSAGYVGTTGNPDDQQHSE